MEEKNEAFFIQHHYDRLFKTIEDEWRKKMKRFSSNIIMIGCLKQLRMSGGKKMNRFSSNIIMIGCLKQLRMSGGKNEAFFIYIIMIGCLKQLRMSGGKK